MTQAAVVRDGCPTPDENGGFPRSLGFGGVDLLVRALNGDQLGGEATARIPDVVR